LVKSKRGKWGRWEDFLLHQSLTLIDDEKVRGRGGKGFEKGSKRGREKMHSLTQIRGDEAQSAEWETRENIIFRICSTSKSEAEKKERTEKGKWHERWKNSVPYLTGIK